MKSTLLTTALILAALTLWGRSIPLPPTLRPLDAPQTVLARLSPLEEAILAAPELGLDPHWVLFTAYAESGFRPWLVGAAGELGQFQIHPKYSPQAKTEHDRALVAVRLLAKYRKLYGPKFERTRLAYTSPVAARTLYGR
jgi:soluble lytic murein transglycosylase-like protein